MNIKLKTPKYREFFKGSSMAKEMLMTFFATTLSIILTFGTAHYVDLHQKRQDGRQTAMMVIHDIDDYVESFRQLAKEEDESFQLALFVLNHLDEIEAIPEDSLQAVLDFIIQNEGGRNVYDDSKERTFLNSQDNWKNIDNPKFIDLVEEFFYKRRLTIQSFSTTIWQEPVPIEEYYELLRKDWSGESVFEYATFLREKLSDPRVVFFIQLSPRRQKFLNETANEWQHTSDQCKFLMGITDQELEEYIKKQERTGRPLKERDLLGRWVNMDNDRRFEGIEFLKDHTFYHTIKQYYPATLYSGKLILENITSGRWELRGDSLYRYYDSSWEYSLDKSQISYTEEMKDSVQHFIERTEASLVSMQEEKRKQPGRTSVRFVSIDASGTKVEMREQAETQNQEQLPAAYMVRDKEK